MTADQIIEGSSARRVVMSIIRRIKAGRPAGASRRPPPVHMATPVICGTCPGNSKANPAERLLDRPPV